MLGSKANRQSLKIGEKLKSSYPHSLGSKLMSGKIEGIQFDKYQHDYTPVLEGHNLFRHKKRSPLEKH